MKKPFGLSLSENGRLILKVLAPKLGLSRAGVIETALRRLAEQHNVEVDASTGAVDAAQSASRVALDADLYGFHPWMRQIAAYARPLETDCPEGLAAEDVLQGVFDKSLRQQTIEDKRAAAGCLKRLGWQDRDKNGVWFPPGAGLKAEVANAL